MISSLAFAVLTRRYCNTGVTAAVTDEEVIKQATA